MHTLPIATSPAAAPLLPEEAPRLRPERFSSGSQVTLDELLAEVEEYFHAGARLGPGATVLDRGANIGAFALRATQLCPGALRIHRFEPAPHLYPILVHNLGATGVECVCAREDRAPPARCMSQELGKSSRSSSSPTASTIESMSTSRRSIAD